MAAVVFGSGNAAYHGAGVVVFGSASVDAMVVFVASIVLRVINMKSSTFEVIKELICRIQHS